MMTLPGRQERDRMQVLRFIVPRSASIARLSTRMVPHEAKLGAAWASRHPLRC